MGARDHACEGCGRGGMNDDGMCTCNLLTEEPTKINLERAWALLQEAEVKTICDLSLNSIAEIVRGSPFYDPKRYSDAEIRLARAVLILRGALVVSERLFEEAEARASGKETP